MRLQIGEGNRNKKGQQRGNFGNETRTTENKKKQPKPGCF